MSRILAALAVAAAFGAALVYGGGAMGAWEPYEPVPDKAGTRTAVKHRPAKGKKGERKQVKSARAATPAKTPLERWADRANAICRKARPDLAALARELSFADSPGEFGTALARLANANKRVNAELRALPAPPGHRADVRALHRLFDQDERLLGRMRTAFQRRDANALRALADDVAPVAEKENDLFWALGASECTVEAYLTDASALAYS